MGGTFYGIKKRKCFLRYALYGKDRDKFRCHFYLASSAPNPFYGWLSTPTQESEWDGKMPMCDARGRGLIPSQEKNVILRAFP